MSHAIILRRGVIYALSAFLLWGFSPIFYNALGAASALEILAHRVVWSVFLTIALVSINGEWNDLINALKQPQLVGKLLISAILVSINWLVFIWAVNHKHALEASMGYFIFPIVMVVLGRLVLAERMTRIQLITVSVVTLGVLNLIVSQGQWPWVALTLATSMGLYSLARKQIAINALLGLTIECLLLFPVAIGYLLYLSNQQVLVFGNNNLTLDLLLAASALMTAVPLILFTAGTRLLRLSTVGMLQYINPSCQFLVALLFFREIFTITHQVTFLLIWTGLIGYTLESRRLYRQQQAVEAQR